VNSDWTSPPTSKVCVMDIEWTEVGVGNLQHKSKYVQHCTCAFRSIARRWRE